MEVNSIRDTLNSKSVIIAESSAPLKSSNFKNLSRNTEASPVLLSRFLTGPSV